MKKYVLLTALLMTAACSGESDPYPYQTVQFVAPAEIPQRALPTPPAENSGEWRREIKEIIARQKAATPADREAIYSEREVEPEMMVIPTLGTSFTRETAPALYTLLIKASSDSWRISDIHKNYWHTTRPWLIDSHVKLFVPEIRSSAYPSGHTVTNFVWASVLSDVLPKQKAIFFKRANQVADHRITAGAHFPHDITGGKRLAKFIYTEMQTKPEYQEAVKAAAAEVEELRAPMAPIVHLPWKPEAEPALSR